MVSHLANRLNCAFQMTAISLSTDPESRDHYGPYVPNLGAVWPDVDASATDSATLTVRFGSVEDLERVLKQHGQTIAAFIVEPIQGEAEIGRAHV